MAEQDRSGKPPAITVRCENWEDYDWIAQAAAKRDQSKGEFCLLSTLQRRGGGAVPPGRKQRAAQARANVATSDEAKANVKPIPRQTPRAPAAARGSR
jgi:hypothetical protein